MFLLSTSAPGVTLDATHALVIRVRDLEIVESEPLASDACRNLGRRLGHLRKVPHIVDIQILLCLLGLLVNDFHDQYILV